MFQNRRDYAVLFILVSLAFVIGITIQGAAQRKGGSSSSTATDYVQLAGVNCTRSLAYWAAHPERYPVSIVIGDQRYRRDQMASILASIDPGQELLRQVVVAFLNSITDGGQPSIDGELLEAYQWLVDHPVGAALVALDRQDNVRLISILEQYNAGQAGLAACDGPSIPTATLAPTPTGTPTSTHRFVPTPTPTSTLTPSRTPTNGASPTTTRTPTLTGTATATVSSAPTGTSTSTRTATLTATPTAIVTYVGTTPTRAKTVRVTPKISPTSTTRIPPTTIAPTHFSPTPKTPLPTTQRPSITPPITKTPLITRPPTSTNGLMKPQSPVPTVTEARLYTPTVTETPPGRALLSDCETACQPVSPVKMARILIVYIRVLDRLGLQPKGR